VKALIEKEQARQDFGKKQVMQQALKSSKQEHKGINFENEV